ncbi:MAG: cytochrome b/b6 domain-containing protein [Thermohalobaculum sp.]|nr:cytochrome b/b6 domain-containing protein [Thermohalobaculum sp.]
MAAPSTRTGGPGKAGGERVWDPLVRLVHWSVVVLFFANVALLDEEGAAHRWAGYALLGLVAVRLAWGVIGTRHARFAAFPPSLGAARRHLGAMLRGKRDVHLSHNPLGALMVYNLLATMIAIGATGWLMTTTAFWGVDWVEEAHEALVNWALISVGLHVAGVLLEQWRSHVPLVRAMITGVKEIPPQP